MDGKTVNAVAPNVAVAVAVVVGEVDVGGDIVEGVGGNGGGVVV